MLIFGENIETEYLRLFQLREILDEGYERISSASKNKIEDIIEILDRVSKAWARPDYHFRLTALKFLPQLTSFSLEMIEAGLNSISEICARENIIKRIIGEIGSLEALEQGKKSVFEKCILKAKGKGVVFHICSGKMFVKCIESIIAGIVTKNVNIIKMSDKDSFFPILFLESIKEFDEKSIVWKNQALIAYIKEDETIENSFFEDKLTVNFYGDYEGEISFWKKTFPNGIFIGDSSFFSFAVVEGKCLKPAVPLEAVRGLAYDICWWNQLELFSPQIVYVLDKDLKTSHQFIEALFDEMIQVNEEFPIGNLSFYDRVKIRNIREITRMKQIKAEGRLVCPEDFGFTLILEYDSNIKTSCLNRTLFVKRVSNMEDLAARLLPLANVLDTAAIYASDESRDYFVKKLIELGVKRVTNIGQMRENLLGTSKNSFFLLRELLDWISIESID